MLMEILREARRDGRRFLPFNTPRAFLSVWHASFPSVRAYKLPHRVRPRFARRPRPPGRPNVAVVRTLAISALVLSVVAAAAFGTLAVIGFMSDSERTVETERMLYGQTGAFDYSAEVKPAVLYGFRPAIDPGEPIFTALSDFLVLSFRYTLESQLATDVRGSIGLDLVMSQQSSGGWTRTIPVSRERPFSGTEAVTTGRVSINSLVELNRYFGAESGTGEGGVDVRIVPVLDVEGTVDGEAVGAFAAPSLDFVLGAGTLSLVADGQPVSFSEPERLASVLSSNVSQSVTETTSQPAEISLLGPAVTVEEARTYGAYGAVLAVLSAAAATLVLVLSRRPRSASERIRDTLGPMVIDVERVDLPSVAANVSVRSIDDLARVAEMDGLPILHHESGSGIHRYFVQDSIVYEFVLTESDERPSASEMALEPGAGG